MAPWDWSFTTLVFSIGAGSFLLGYAIALTMARFYFRRLRRKSHFQRHWEENQRFQKKWAKTETIGTTLDEPK